MTKDIGKKVLKYTNHRTNLPQITENCKKVLVVRNIYINFAPKNYDNMAEYKKRISDSQQV